MNKHIKYILSLALLMLTMPFASWGQESPVLKKLLNLEDNRYFADRDSAFLDPYYGLKSLSTGTGGLLITGALNQDKRKPI